MGRAGVDGPLGWPGDCRGGIPWQQKGTALVTGLLIILIVYSVGLSPMASHVLVSVVSSILDTAITETTHAHSRSCDLSVPRSGVFREQIKTWNCKAKAIYSCTVFLIWVGHAPFYE